METTCINCGEGAVVSDDYPFCCEACEKEYIATSEPPDAQEE
jgi:endogenous inhibitor of DNA gyrase (YacG/DUF329 family)